MRKYIVGTGNVPLNPGKNYYKAYLKRTSINKKEYIHFVKIWKKLDIKDNVVKHKKSVVERILRKYNTQRTKSTWPV